MIMNDWFRCLAGAVENRPGGYEQAEFIRQIRTEMVPVPMR